MGQKTPDNELSITGAIEAIAQGHPERSMVIESMEHHEDWIVDAPGSPGNRMLDELGELMAQGGDELVARSAFDSISEKDLTLLLALIRSGRFYRFLRALGSVDTPFINNLIQMLDRGDSSDPELNVIHSRLVLAEQMDYLVDLFSDARIDTLNLAVEEVYGQV